MGESRQRKRANAIEEDQMMRERWIEPAEREIEHLQHCGVGARHHVGGERDEDAP